MERHTTDSDNALLQFPEEDGPPLFLPTSVSTHSGVTVAEAFLWIVLFAVAAAVVYTVVMTVK